MIKVKTTKALQKIKIEDYPKILIASLRIKGGHLEMKEIREIVKAVEKEATLQDLMVTEKILNIKIRIRSHLKIQVVKTEDLVEMIIEVMEVEKENIQSLTQIRIRDKKVIKQSVKGL